MWHKFKGEIIDNLGLALDTLPKLYNIINCESARS